MIFFVIIMAAYKLFSLRKNNNQGKGKGKERDNKKDEEEVDEGGEDDKPYIKEN